MTYKAMYKSELGLHQTARRNFMDNYIKPAQTQGLICFAFPNSPNKPGQAYRLTAAGLAWHFYR